MTLNISHTNNSLQTPIAIHKGSVEIKSERIRNGFSSVNTESLYFTDRKNKKNIVKISKALESVKQKTKVCQRVKLFKNCGFSKNTHTYQKLLPIKAVNMKTKSALIEGINKAMAFEIGS